MRILHTSDWHLGLSTGVTSRLEDQQRFLSWLTERLAADEVDLLIVAGDVFDSMQPSSEALSTYYRFLAGLSATGVRDVVIVGGNHDSPSRLEAPRDVLAALNVKVIGTLPRQDESLDSLVIPLRDRQSEEVEAVCLAVPFVHEYRLGVRTTELDRAAVVEAFRERFTELYTGLADRAEELYPGRPIIATGHLVLGDASRDDYHDEIHQVGFIGGLPLSVLDSRVVYAALGHIHRAWPVIDKRAWYSGSPIPLSVSESTGARKVLLVDLEVTGAAEVSITPVDVPEFRQLREVSGTPEELEVTLRTLTSSAPLPPLLYVRARLKAPEPGLRDRLHSALDGFIDGARPQIVEVREVFGEAVMELSGVPPIGLDELTLREVFLRLCQSAGVQDGANMVQALATLETLSADDFDVMVLEARDGTGGDA